ncbi:hypothetical protein [Aquimarina aquimarini]|uniref:hypothetical protein n=1 Tax=Aquimarina aquimarini TaxID=1191734 RepID=UPI000D55D013|nr:hypothetical protein [Aquimarina aquimarini]
MIIILTNIPFIDRDTFSVSTGKGISFSDYSRIYQKIKKWINLDDSRGSELIYNETDKFRECIVTELSGLLTQRESPPENATEKQLKKWLKKHPRKIVEILGKKISIGGLGLIPPPLDREIITYNKLLGIVDNCIDINSPLYIKVEKNYYTE